MKNFLAIDTSGDTLSVVVRKDGRCFSAFLTDCAMKHSVLLMDTINEVFKKARLTPSECDFFAAVVGAGSFTGIRIGISAIKGFALACKKPTLSITSFDTLAYNSIEREGKILCLVDALHGSYYACGYENGKIVYPPAYIDEAEVLALCQSGYTPVAGASLELAQKIPVETVSLVTGLERAVCALCQDEGNFGELEALYIRKSSAELNRERSGS